MHFKKMHLLQELPGGCKFLLRFSRKSYDHIRCNGRMVKTASQDIAPLHVILGGIMTVHPFQRLAAAALQGQMEMGAELGKPGQYSGKFHSDDPWLQGTQPDPLQAGDLMDP